MTRSTYDLAAAGHYDREARLCADRPTRRWGTCRDCRHWTKGACANAMSPRFGAVTTSQDRCLYWREKE